MCAYQQIDYLKSPDLPIYHDNEKWSKYSELQKPNNQYQVQATIQLIQFETQKKEVSANKILKNATMAQDKWNEEEKTQLRKQG